MEIPLIPDLSNPKWLIVQKVLKSIGSAHAKKVASRLKIQDVEIFLDCIRILILGDTFELDYSPKSLKHNFLYNMVINHAIKSYENI